MLQLHALEVELNVYSTPCLSLCTVPGPLSASLGDEVSVDLGDVVHPGSQASHPTLGQLPPAEIKLNIKELFLAVMVISL